MNLLKAGVLAVALLMAAGTNAQSNGPVAVFLGTPSEFKVKSDGTETKFILKATEAELNAMLAESAKYSSYLIFEAAPSSAGQYQCTLTITGQMEAGYVAKMFAAFGIAQFETSEGVQPLNQLEMYLDAQN